jgi:hypothetical protein
MDVLTGIGETPLENPPYDSDLYPCDFWAFPTVKRELRGQNRLTILLQLAANGLQRVFEK